MFRSTLANQIYAIAQRFPEQFRGDIVLDSICQILEDQRFLIQILERSIEASAEIRHGEAIDVDLRGL